MIRVLIADDHPLFREGIRRIMERAPDITVVGDTGTTEGLVELAKQTRADVVLLDLEIPGPGHLQVIEALRNEAPHSRILVVSGHSEADHAVPAMRAGAAGYVGKMGQPSEVVEAVRRVNAGRRYVSADLGEQLAAGLTSAVGGPPHLELSSRELQVLTMIAGGRSLKEIAGRLEINPKTVSSYRARVLEKLGLRTNAELVKYALEHDLATG
jgi:two-component system invasion response regulator UvrY